MQLRHNCTPLFLNQSTFDYFRAVYKNVLLTKKNALKKKIECEYQQKKKKGKENKKQKGNIMERFYVAEKSDIQELKNKTKNNCNVTLNAGSSISSSQGWNILGIHYYNTIYI